MRALVGLVLAGCVGTVVTLWLSKPPPVVIMVNNTPCFVCHIPPLLTYRAYSDYWEQRHLLEELTRYEASDTGSPRL